MTNNFDSQTGKPLHEKSYYSSRALIRRNGMRKFRNKCLLYPFIAVLLILLGMTINAYADGFNADKEKQRLHDVAETARTFEQIQSEAWIDADDHEKQAREAKKYRHNEAEKQRRVKATAKCKWEYIDRTGEDPKDKCDHHYAGVSEKVDTRDVIIKTAIDHDIKPEDMLALNQFENGAMISDLQSKATTFNVRMILWCRGQKLSGSLPEKVNCQKEASFGIYQINLYVHRGVSYEQATDPVYAATWTAKRLIAKNYKTDRWNAITAHNGYKKLPNGKTDYSYARAVINRSSNIKL